MTTKPSQVGIAVFYDHTTQTTLPCSIVIIDSPEFMKSAQEDQTKFYVLGVSDYKGGNTPGIVSYTYKAVKATNLTLVGIIHIGSTTKNPQLTENQIVASQRAQPKGYSEQEANQWAVDTAFDYVLSEPVSGPHRALVQGRVESLCRYWQHKVTTTGCCRYIKSIEPEFHSVFDLNFS
ncbi:hypothetical protein BJ165DRAFT_1597350 [Panaeolus papilionaceus]|nr:hypothetical protein BJ165DRAFT_1597350 [Panaeolus papilionaceus]